MTGEIEPSSFEEDIREALWDQALIDLLEKNGKRVSRVRLVDPQTGVISIKTRYDDDSSYYREDKYPNSRYSRNLDEHRSNGVFQWGFYSVHGQLVLGPNTVYTSTRLHLDKDSQRLDLTMNFYEGPLTFGFDAQYNNSGRLAKFELEQKKYQETEHDAILKEDFKEYLQREPTPENLRQFIDLFILGRQEIMETIQTDQHHAHIDFSASPPRLKLTQMKKNRNWTQESIDKTAQHVSGIVQEYLEKTCQEILTSEDITVLGKFLGILTTEALVTFREIREDSTVLKFTEAEVLKRLFRLGEDLMIEYEHQLIRKGQTKAHFNLITTGSVGFEITGYNEVVLKQEEVGFGQSINYETHSYQVDQTENSVVLTATSLLDPNYLRRFKIPKQVDMQTLTSVMTVDESTGWEQALDLVPKDVTIRG